MPIPYFFTLIVAAYALLHKPNTADMINSNSIPSVCQIQPPNNAMKIVIRWLIDTPVEIVAFTSSELSASACTYTFDAMDAWEIIASSM